MGQLIKRYGPFRGLNTRMTDLVDKDGFFVDCKNAYVDQGRDDVINRPGFTKSTTDAAEKDGLFVYGKQNELLTAGTTLKKYNTTSDTWDNVSTHATNPLGLDNIDGVVDTAELGGVTYIAKEGQPLSKYDGSGLMYAGSSVVIPTGSWNIPNTKLYIGIPTTSINISTDTFTAALHGFVTGQTIITESTGGPMPSPLLDGFTYYAIVVNANEFKLASTVQNAYDGIAINITTVGTGTNNYIYDLYDGGFQVANYKLIYELETTDHQGNIVFAQPYNATETFDAATVSLADSTIRGTATFGDIPNTSDGFANHTAICDGTLSGGQIGVTSNTLEVGDTVYLLSDFAAANAEYEYRPFKVSASTPTYVEFDIDSSLYTIVLPGKDELFSSWIVRCYIDSDISGAYTENFYPARFSTPTLDYAQITGTFQAPFDITQDSYQLKISSYDSTETPYELQNKEKYLPQKARAVEEWSDLLWTVGEFQVRIDTDPNNPHYQDQLFDHTVFHSNIDDGLLDSVEDFNPANGYKVGKEIDGKITALAKNNGGLIVFKEKNMYTLTGDPFTRAISIDVVNGTSIGCVARNSVQDIGGDIFFLSDRGVYKYRVGYNKATEVSQFIYDVFQDSTLVLETATSTHDTDRMLYILHIPRTTGSGITLAYDYFRDGWWIWEDIDMQYGVTYYSNELYFNYDNSTVANTAKENSTNKDNLTGTDTAISFEVEPCWETANASSVSKKFKEVKIFSTPLRNVVQNTTTNPDFTLNIKAYKDWDKSTNITDEDVTFNTETPRQEKKLDGGKRECKSLGLKFSHSTIGKEVRISGWEVETSLVYTHSKKFDDPKR